MPTCVALIVAAGRGSRFGGPLPKQYASLGGQPVLRHKKPNVGKTYPIEVPADSDDFDSPKLGLQWQWWANFNPDWASLTARPGAGRKPDSRPIFAFASNRRRS